MRGYRWPFVVAIVGLLATVGLTWLAASLNSSNERRLLNLRAKEVGAALPVALVGQPPVLNSATGMAARLFARASATARLSVAGFLSGPRPRLGYAFGASVDGRYIAYAESALPAGRFTRPPSGSAYSNLDFALCLGRSTTRSDLLLTTVRQLLLSGQRATVGFDG
jgi:hypothetical protein